MWQDINYFFWGGSAGIEKKGGYRRNNYCTWWIIGRCLPFVDYCHDRPSTRLIPVASASPFACIEYFTICHLRRHFGGYRWERWWGINGIGRRGAT